MGVRRGEVQERGAGERQVKVYEGVRGDGQREGQRLERG